MKKVSVLICLTLVVLLTLGGVAEAGKKKPKKKNKKAKAEVVLVLTADQLAPAMLALSDMPIGWATDPIPPVEPNATSGYCNGPNAAARAQSSNAVSINYVGFAQDPSFGPWLHGAIYEFPTTKDAQTFLNETRASFASCPSFSHPTEEGDTRTITPSELSFPLGSAQQMVAIRENIELTTSSGFTDRGTGDVVYARVDNHVVSVSRAGSSTDPDQLNAFVGKALSKLGVAIQAAKANK